METPTETFLPTLCSSDQFKRLLLGSTKGY